MGTKKLRPRKLTTKLVQETLQVDQMYSYKQLTEVLRQEYYESTCSKNSQLKNFSRFFDFEKIGSKYLIHQIYDKALPIEKRISNRTKYVKHIEKLLLHMFAAQEPENYQLYITSSVLWLRLGLINENYLAYKNERKFLVDQMIEEIAQGNKVYANFPTLRENATFCVENFYNRCNNNFPSIVNSALRSLENRCIIRFNKVYMVSQTDENGRIRIYQASSKDVTYILDLKRKLLDKYKCQTEIELVWKNKIDEYYKKINDKIKKEKNWNYIYSAYHIIYLQKYALRLLTQEELQITQHELNDLALEKTAAQAKTLYNKSLLPESYSYPENYIFFQSYLTDKLTDIRYEDERILIRQYQGERANEIRITK